MSFWTSRALVTGAAGFIGSHLAQALVRRGVDVLGFDNFRSGSKEIAAELDDIHFEEVDVCSDKAAERLSQFRPDAIFHLAAQINVRKSVEEPLFDAEQNVMGTLRLLDAASKSGVRQFLFASTGGAIYGEQDYFPADESHPIRPKCPYGVSKRAAEQYLEFYGRHTPLQTTSLRFSNVYGPRQNPKGEAGVVAIFTDRLLKGEELCVNGDGEQTRDFVYVEDVVNGLLKAGGLRHESGYDVFNIGRGEETSVNEVVTQLREVWSALGQDVAQFVVRHGPALAGEQQRSVISAKKLNERVDWSPRVDLRSGLERTVRSFLGRE